MFSKIPGNIQIDLGECLRRLWGILKEIPRNVQEDSGGIFKEIMGNVQEDSGEC